MRKFLVSTFTAAVFAAPAAAQPPAVPVIPLQPAQPPAVVPVQPAQPPAAVPATPAQPPLADAAPPATPPAVNPATVAPIPSMPAPGGVSQPMFGQPIVGQAMTPKASDFDAVYDAIRDNPALRGAYLAVGPEGVRPYVDEDAADRQTQALSQALASSGSPFAYNMLPAERLPVAKLVARLQGAIENDPLFTGVKINGIYFDAPHDKDGRRASDPHKRWLYIYGRVSPQANRKEVRERLEAIAVRAMERGPAWATLQKTEQVVVKLDLTEVPPSTAAALINYRAGVKSFFACDYGSASSYFADALVEDPTNPTYIYWRALAEIGKGDTEAAYKLIRPYVQSRRGNYGGTFDDLMLQPFERVQGPIRSALHELERRALVEPVGPSYR